MKTQLYILIFCSFSHANVTLACYFQSNGKQQVRILLLKIYVTRDGATVEAAAFRTLLDILSRPVVGQ